MALSKVVPVTPVTEAELNAVWGNADFGTMSKTDVVREGLLKLACGYANGRTLNCILHELDLITSKFFLTRRGRYMLWVYYSPKKCPRCLKERNLFICEPCYESLCLDPGVLSALR